MYDKVNLVITDIEMPEMDGHRLTKLIKDDEHLKRKSHCHLLVPD